MSYIKARIRVLKNRNLVLHLIGCLLATLGGGMAHITMLWMVIENDSSITAAASLMACYWLPCVVLAPLLGVLSDRFERKHLLVATNLLRAIGFFVVGTYFFFSQQLYCLYFLALLVGTFNALSMPVTMALVPEITAEKDLFYANASVDMAYEIGFMLGMTFGGVAIAFLSNTTSLYLNGLCFIIATILALKLKVPQRRPDSNQKSTIASFFADARAGINYLRRRPQLAKVYSLQTVLMVCYMTAPILLAPFVRSVLQGDASDLGIIEAAFSLGMIAGSLFTPYIARHWGENTIFTTLSIGLLLGYVLFMFCNSTVAACLIYILIGFCLSTWALCVTRAQNYTHGDFQGRIQSTFHAFSGVAILGTYLLVSVLSTWIPVRYAYGVQAIFALIAIALVIAVSKPHTDPV